MYAHTHTHTHTHTGHRCAGSGRRRQNVPGTVQSPHLPISGLLHVCVCVRGVRADAGAQKRESARARERERERETENRLGHRIITLLSLCLVCPFPLCLCCLPSLSQCFFLLARLHTRIPCIYTDNAVKQDGSGGQRHRPYCPVEGQC